MLRIPLSKKRENKFFVGLDIGTETAKALIFEIINEKINILGASLEYFDDFGIFDSRDFEKDVYKKIISKVIKEAQKEAKIEKLLPVLLSLPANIFKGRVVFHQISRKNHKEVIDKKEEESIFQLVFKNIKDEISQNFRKETGILPEDIQFISLDVLEMKIDGYPVSYLKGFDGRLLDFKILATFLPKHYLQNIQKTIDSLGLKIFKLFHQSQYFLEPQTLTSDAVFIDIGGKVTQIFLVRDGRLETVDEFKIGGELFSQTLSQILGIRLLTARNLKHQYSRGILSEGTRKRVGEEFLQLGEDWFLELKSKLSDQKNLISSAFFLFGGGSLVPEIGAILEDGNWGLVPLTGSPQIKFLYPKDILGTSTFTSGAGKTGYNLDDPQYTPILLNCFGFFQNRKTMAKRTSSSSSPSLPSEARFQR